jgi:hypothetical protein
MAETTYSYVATDFAGSKLNPANLMTEIRASTIVTALDRIDTVGGTKSQGVIINPTSVNVVFKNALSAADKTILDGDTTGPAGGLIAAHDNGPKLDKTPALDIHGNTKVSASIGIGGGFRYITHNFCDKCSWWHESTEHVDQATTSSDQLVYDITGHDSLIDVRHGRVTFEDDITSTTVGPNGNAMTNIVPTVKVNTVALAQSNEGATTGDDRYTINYATGVVTFVVARQVTDTVVASFRKAGSSKYTLAPAAGKRLVLEDAEVDLSEDLNMVAAAISTVHGSHSIVTGGNVVPLQVRKYKTFHDFQAAARKFWGPLPANFGGVGGVNSQKWTFQWEYTRSDEIYATKNYVDLNIDPTKITANKIVLSTTGDAVLGGSYLTLTFYGQELSEGNGG